MGLPAWLYGHVCHMSDCQRQVQDNITASLLQHVTLYFRCADGTCAICGASSDNDCGA